MASFPLLITLLILIQFTSIFCYDHWSYDKGPNTPQTKQYISHPYKSLEEECQKARRIVEHCKITDDGDEQYVECDYKTNFWKPVLRVVKCEFPKDKCVEQYSTEMKTNAECSDETSKPSFPKTGTISWKGTVVYDKSNFYWRPRIGPREQTAHVHGKMWRDTHGNFYSKAYKVDVWHGMAIGSDDTDNKKPPVMKTEFLILKADENGKFIQYKIKEKEKCERKVVDTSTESLTSLWKPLMRGFNEWKLTSRKRLNGKKEEQKWENKIVASEWDSLATWTMHYNKSAGHAVPVSMKWVYNDDYSGRETEQYQYHYQPLKEDDTVIDIPEYC